MKTLYLVRHAKSSWNEPGLEDLERPLNKRGKDDAPAMGKLLNKRGESPELMISSPAKRAHSTAKRFAKQLGYSKDNIIIDEGLYMADRDDFMKTITSAPDSLKSLMLFSHNYGVTYFSNQISDSNIDNIPTCGVVRIDFDADSWKELESKKGKMIFFEYPKRNKI